MGLFVVVHFDDLYLHRPVLGLDWSKKDEYQ